MENIFQKKLAISSLERFKILEDTRGRLIQLCLFLFCFSGNNRIDNDFSFLRLVTKLTEN